MWSFSFIFGHQLKLGGADDDDDDYDNSGIIQGCFPTEQLYRVEW